MLDCSLQIIQLLQNNKIEAGRRYLKKNIKKIPKNKTLCSSICIRKLLLKNRQKCVWVKGKGTKINRQVCPLYPR